MESPKDESTHELYQNKINEKINLNPVIKKENIGKARNRMKTSTKVYKIRQDIRKKRV